MPIPQTAWRQDGYHRRPRQESEGRFCRKRKGRRLLNAVAPAQEEGDPYPTGADKSIVTKFAARSTDVMPTLQAPMDGRPTTAAKVPSVWGVRNTANVLPV